MSTAHITIDPDGTNHLSIDGTPATPVKGTGQTAQNTAMETLRQHAKQTQQTVSLHVADNDGSTFHLRIAPDGQVWTAPPATTDTRTPHTPDPLTIPRVDQTPPQTITEVPGATPGEPRETAHQPTSTHTDWTSAAPSSTHEDIDATRPRPIAPQQPQPFRTVQADVNAAMIPAAPIITEPEGEDEYDAAIRENGGETIRLTASHGGQNLDPLAGPVPQLAPETDPEPARTPDPVESDPRWADISRQPATQGFRGTLNGMGLKLAPAEDELAERREALRQEIAREEQARIADEQRAQDEAAQETRRAAREREAAEKDRAERTIIQTPLEEPKHVLIANDKGGQGKTSGTYCIAATAGRIRGGDVIAWDANETRGNLGFRSRKATTSRSVVDLLEDAVEDFTTVEGSKRSTLAKFTRSQGDNLFSVLASDENPENQDLVDADAFEKVNEILGRFYSLILVDTGNNHRVSHFRAALAAADQLVIPVSAGADGAHAAETMLDTFESLGYHDLVKNAVVLLNDSATRRGNATGIAAKFDQRVRAIIPIPFDPALDSGDEIDFEALQPATRAAYQEATAAIATGLAATEER